MRLHPAGKPVIIVGVFLVSITQAFVIAWLWSFPILIFSLLFFLLIFELWFLRFFRYPKRKAPIDQDNSIYSAADGKVVVIEQLDHHPNMEGKPWQVSIFMSIYNVHLNYVPISGVIQSVIHQQGRFSLARHPKASMENEMVITTIQLKSGQRIIVKQIAGAVAKRIIPFLAAGQITDRGDELGFIRFGSRVDLIMPEQSKIQVNLGDRVKACLSKIGEL